MDNKERRITWNAEKDFLERYRALMERVKNGDNDA
jgi:hypothetical protein